jgi:hypothetical protein
VLLAFCAIPLVVAGKQLLLRELCEAGVQGDCLLASLEAAIIVQVAVQSESFDVKVRFFVDHDLKTELPLILDLSVQVSQLYLTATFLKVVSAFVIVRADFADVIALIVSSAAELALSFPLPIAASAHIRRVILDLQVDVLVKPFCKFM